MRKYRKKVNISSENILEMQDEGISINIHTFMQMNFPMTCNPLFFTHLCKWIHVLEPSVEGRPPGQADQLKYKIVFYVQSAILTVPTL